MFSLELLQSNAWMFCIVLCEFVHAELYWLQGFSGFYHTMKDLGLPKENTTFDQFMTAVNNCTNILSSVRDIFYFYICIYPFQLVY